MTTVVSAAIGRTAAGTRFVGDLPQAATARPDADGAAVTPPPHDPTGLLRDRTIVRRDLGPDGARNSALRVRKIRLARFPQRRGHRHGHRRDRRNLVIPVAPNPRSAPERNARSGRRSPSPGKGPGVSLAGKARAVPPASGIHRRPEATPSPQGPRATKVRVSVALTTAVALADRPGNGPRGTWVGVLRRSDPQRRHPRRALPLAPVRLRRRRRPC